MNKGQFPKSNKTISGFDLPNGEQDNDVKRQKKIQRDKIIKDYTEMKSE